MLMILLTTRLLVAATALLTVTVVVGGLKPRDENVGITWDPYQGGNEEELPSRKFFDTHPYDSSTGTTNEPSEEAQSTWTFLRSLPGKPHNVTRGLNQYEWLIFNQTHPLLKRWRLVATTRPVQDTILGEAYGRVEPAYPVPPKMELSTWDFDNYATRCKQSEQSTWTFLGKTRRKSKIASRHVMWCEWLLFNQTDPSLKRWRVVAIARPVMINIQPVGVHQNLSEPDITPREVRGQVEPTDTGPPMKEPSAWNYDDNAARGTHSEQGTWEFLRSYRGKSHKLTRDLKLYEWLIFNQTDPLLKRWRLVATTRPVPDTTLGEAHERLKPTNPVPPRMEPCTWNFDVNNTRCEHSESTWKILGKIRRNSNDDTCHDVKRYEWLLFNQTYPLLKRWRLVATTRPVMIDTNIPSMGMPQNSLEPDTTLGKAHGQVKPTDPDHPKKTPEIEDTVEYNHEEKKPQIAETGAAVDSAYQMKIIEKKSEVKVVRSDPLERDFM